MMMFCYGLTDSGFAPRVKCTETIRLTSRLAAHFYNNRNDQEGLYVVKQYVDTCALDFECADSGL
jgi:hypothetical protein